MDFHVSLVEDVMPDTARNDIIKKSLDSAKIPSHLEPVSLSYHDGKRPDGATVVPWREGRALVWDVTCLIL